MGRGNFHYSVCQIACRDRCGLFGISHAPHAHDYDMQELDGTGNVFMLEITNRKSRSRLEC